MVIRPIQAVVCGMLVALPVEISGAPTWAWIMAFLLAGLIVIWGSDK